MEDVPENISRDYSYVDSSARIALYDDLLSLPRIIDIDPGETKQFITDIATEVYEQARAAGGSIPFTIIMQVTENFIHAKFAEIVISIMDKGNTIRFTDQGPGIQNKEKAQQPGYSSATKEMKEYINGVGSGLPIVKEYLETKQGLIEIEDNINSGAVITISLDSVSKKDDSHKTSMNHDEASQNTLSSLSVDLVLSGLSNRSKSILSLFNTADMWGVKDISDELGIAASSTHNELKKLEEAGMITKLGTKRVLTEFGSTIAQNFA